MSADSARRFVFALHCHQPAGNLPQVMQEAYARCYEPLLQTIQRFPQVKVCLHMSGALLEHAVLNRANLVQDLKERGFRWDDGVYTTLDPPPDRESSGAIAINARYAVGSP